MAERSGFPCARCGECCRHVNLVPELAEYDRGDGVCVKLVCLCGLTSPGTLTKKAHGAA